MFDCCHKCTAPKRHPGCHDHCKEYKDTKAGIAEKKAEDDRRRHRTARTVSAQRADAVAKAERKRRYRW